MIAGVHTAFVAATSPLTVKESGSSAAVPALKNAAYTPVVGDRVAVVPFDSTKLLIICKVA